MFESRCTVRPLTRELLRQHLPRLLEIDSDTIGESWSPSHWSLDLPGKWELSRVAIVNGAITAYLIASRKGETIHIHRAATARERRSLGFGAQLFQHLARAALSEGCSALSGKVHKTNIRAQAFLTRLGFKVIAEDRDNICISAAPVAIWGVRETRSSS
jgi:ribosomal protein S18 acetylase RimI-like enzyme